MNVLVSGSLKNPQAFKAPRTIMILQYPSSYDTNVKTTALRRIVYFQALNLFVIQALVKMVEHVKSQETRTPVLVQMASLEPTVNVRILESLID